MAMTLKQGGIRWRETFYPIASLRTHHAEFTAAPGRPRPTDSREVAALVSPGDRAD
jgi:hypothetical protein